MNRYSFLDKVSMHIGSKIAGKHTYFCDGIESKSIEEMLTSIHVASPTIKGEGFYRVRISYEQLDLEAGFRIAQWVGESYPTIIYHHGAAEGSYDRSFKSILARKMTMIKANIIGIQAIFNHSNREFMESIGTLSNYVLLLSSSTALIEHIIRKLTPPGSGKYIVTGTSLGGFITNLHACFFNSADVYLPLLAGARLGDVFTHSAYSLVTSSKIQNCPEKIHKVLNFDQKFRKCNQEKIFPVLGKYDQIIIYDVHKQDFLEKNIKTIPYGHASGATKFDFLRAHILEHVL